MGLEWDQEAIDRARQQAAECQRRDPEAARLLLAQVEAEYRAVAARPASPEEITAASYTPGDVYDPLDLYCRLAREFHWSDSEMDRMDYVRFFGYVDRLSRQHEKEEQERKNAGNGTVNEAIVDAEAQAMVAGLAPAPVPYQGKTVAFSG